MDDVFDAYREAIEGAALGEGQLVEAAGLGEDEVGVEMGPGSDGGLAGLDMGEEGSGIGFGGEEAVLQEIEGVGCAEEVGLFCHFRGGEGEWMVGGLSTSLVRLPKNNSREGYI